MASAAVERTSRFQIADPMPGYCSACFDGAREGMRFVDFDCALDRGSIVVEDGALVGWLDDLYLCETCVRQAAEVLAVKPAQISELLRTIRLLEDERDHWHDYAKRVEGAINKRPDPPTELAPKRGGGRR